MEINPTRMCELLVGLPQVTVLGIEDVAGLPLVVHIESRTDQGWCPGCGVRAQVKDRAAVSLVDLPCFGRQSRLVWHKLRWQCGEAECQLGSWTVRDPKIAAPRAGLSDRAGRWATAQVGRSGRPVSEVAVELGCDWSTVMAAVKSFGDALLAADTDRCAGVEALGLDETLFVKRGPRHLKAWATSVVDVGGAGREPKLVEVIEGRTAKTVPDWIDDQPEVWRGAIRWGTLDMSGPYRKVFNDSLPDAVQVADPFHVAQARELQGR